eukprot:TRINITY_DN1012_c0_g1_i1.p1 TRINITY_DN1012_c0_g1~~TRINITY_DN1012_c0_g1_i1.p1  ORF type:complete len:590 (+),score=99.48 TRINITY_DN1012_c0_g1_i1:228-1997(+)
MEQQLVSQMDSLKTSILDLIGLLSALSPGDVHRLVSVAAPSLAGQIELNLFGLRDVISNVSLEEFQRLLRHANKYFDLEPVANPDVKSQEVQFTVLMLILRLQELLSTLSMVQLLKLFEFIPRGEPMISKLSALQALQKLFASISEADLVTLVKELSSKTNGEGSEVLLAITKLVKLPSEDWFQYEGLYRLLVHSSLDEILVLHSTFPEWPPQQLVLSAQLAEVSVFDIVDLMGILNRSAADEQVLAAPPPPQTLDLSIASQPPEKCVYKRNVRPPPSVKIEGPLNTDEVLYVVPILTRCDTQEDLPNLITGNSPVRVTASDERTIVFGRLKVSSTTHQLNETMFTLRFELRRYDTPSDTDYHVISEVTTDPFSVVSHSTQLKPSARSLPKVIEVIPYSGPETGSTRVAILGVNFQDSPTTRVRFDNVEVMPIFHGSKTLICHTPRHSSGTVTVIVCNEPNGWSLKAGTFTYQQNQTPSLSDSGSIAHAFNSTVTLIVPPQPSNSNSSFSSPNNDSTAPPSLSLPPISSTPLLSPVEMMSRRNALMDSNSNRMNLFDTFGARSTDGIANPLSFSNATTFATGNFSTTNF